MRKVSAFLLLLLFGFIGICFWFWDSSAPRVEWQGPTQLGRESNISLRVVDSEKGIGKVEVFLQQGEEEHSIYSRAYETGWLPWEKGPVSENVSLAPSDWQIENVPREGEFQLLVRTEGPANLWLFAPADVVEQALMYDRTPPRVEVLSRQHYIRQGGSEALLYRLFEEGITSGVQVGDKRFKGYPVPGHEPGTHIVLFALPHDDPVDTPMQVWAEDQAGNRSQTGFWNRVFAQQFRSRNIQVTDSLINKIAPEILSRVEEVSQQDSLKETFLQINDHLRQINARQIEEITSDSAAELLWNEPFLQLSNSQVESAFADHRTYVYEGEEIDRQTHLGFDLASLAQTPVEAANSGRVAFADYLGIYGNCAVIDHGLGLFSLYGHLSSIDVQPGEMVSRGQTLGRTGQTGLAAGDHLHFSMVLQGVQVNPIEWWDGKWVDDHLFAKLRPVHESDDADSSPAP